MPGPSSPESEKSTAKPNIFTKLEALRHKKGKKGGLTKEQLAVINKFYPDVPLSELDKMPPPAPSQNPSDETKAESK